MDSKITLEIWSGALAVPLARHQVDAARLSVAKQAELHRLLADPEIARLPEVSNVPTERPDGKHFKMVLQDSGQTRTVRVPDEKVSPALRRLFDFVAASGTSAADSGGKK